MTDLVQFCFSEAGQIGTQHRPGHLSVLSVLCDGLLLFAQCHCLRLTFVSSAATVSFDFLRLQQSQAEQVDTELPVTWDTQSNFKFKHKHQIKTEEEKDGNERRAQLCWRHTTE